MNDEQRKVEDTVARGPEEPVVLLGVPLEPQETEQPQVEERRQSRVSRIIGYVPAPVKQVAVEWLTLRLRRLFRLDRKG